jgi:hypothetical protein
MGGINLGRLMLGTLVAGIVIFVIEGAMASTYTAELTRVLQEHNLTMGGPAAGMVLGAVISLLIGFGLMFFYVCARPRFGAGVRTAIIVAVVMFFTGYFVGLLSYDSIGLYPQKMLVQWGALGLIEMIIACIAGAWLYRE